MNTLSNLVQTQWFSVIKDLSVLAVAIWALWGQFSITTSSSVTAAIMRMLIGLGSVVLLVRFNDHLTSWLVGILLLAVATSMVNKNP